MGQPADSRSRGRRAPSAFSRVLGFFLLWLALGAAPAAAQAPTLTFIDTVPPGIRLFPTPQFTLEYDVTSDMNNGVTIDFFRDDGMGQVTVVIADPAGEPRPITVALPLKTNVDRVSNQFTGVVRDNVNGEIALAGPFEVFSDDIGPDPPTISTPAFPATTFSDFLRIEGLVDNMQAGGPTLPETSGQVLIQRTDDQSLLGGGPIAPDSSFAAVIDLSGFAIDTPVMIDLFAIDSVGNTGTTLTVEVTRMIAGDPVLTATIEPMDGAITGDPGVLVSGSVAADIGPVTVHIFVDGLLHSQVAGLSPGESFIHTVNLPGEGAHTIAAQATAPGQVPSAATAEQLGTVTLDRTPPAAPIILDPDPAIGALITNAGDFLLQGISGELDSNPDDTLMPVVLLQGPSGVVFDPPSPLAPDPSGAFMSMVDISALADGTYTLDVVSVDEAGNSDGASIARVTFTRDTQPPAVERVTVAGRLAPSAEPEIYVGFQTVPIEVTFTEPVVSAPALTVTQLGGTPVPAGIGEVTTRTVTYFHGISGGFDGPVDVEIAGGSDAAGNPAMATLTRLFVADTAPPSVVGVEPDRDEVTMAAVPRIRVRFDEPRSPAETFVGVDLLASTITLEGPLESAGAMVPGTLTPFDPFTLDFVPAEPLVEDGTYRIVATPIDRVQNRGGTFISSFRVDRTPIALSDNLVASRPFRNQCVNSDTIPGGASPFVEVTVFDPDFDAAASQLVVRDFCRVPPEIPGTKEVVDSNTIRYTFTSPLRRDGGADGVYAIQLDAFDTAGNASPTFTIPFLVDNLGPEVVATFPVDAAAVNGPLRIVDASLVDENPDSCRRAGGLDQSGTQIALTLQTPNPRTNVTPPETPVEGTIRFLSVGAIDKALLELVDSAGFPAGLRNDGTDDGVYRLSVEAFDCASNTRGMVITTFVYDTIRPLLEVAGLADGATISGPDLALTGRLVDDLGGSGIDRVTATLEPLDGNGNVSGAPFFRDTPGTFDPAAIDDPQPNTNWVLAADLRRLPRGVTPVRLKVRGFDRAGNFDEATFFLNASSTAVPAPQLSAPASEAATSAQILGFAWSPVAGASRYRLRVTSPNGDVINQDTAGPETFTSLNLLGLPEPEGRFLWAVAALDGTGTPGPFSPNRVFFIDRGAPRVVAIDVTDPSPEAVGSINEGLVRVSVRFSEAMDPTRPPTIQVRLANPNAPRLPVQVLSYDGDLLQGEFTIPEVDELGHDPNGIAAVEITGAFDRAGNENRVVQGGITLFEVDTGPFWRIATFKNPIDDQDVVLVVKGFQRDGGLGDDIADLPSVVVEREGQGDQALEMRRVSNASFRGAFRLDRDSVRDVTVRIAGRDADGNTSTRTIPLAVERLSPNEEIRIQAAGLVVAVPPGAVARAVSAFGVAASASLRPALPGGELAFAGGLPQLGPLGLTLGRPAAVTVGPEWMPADLAGVGLFQREGEGYRLLAPATPAGISTTTDRLAPLALLVDRTPPTVGEPELAWEGGRLRVSVPVEDRGAGVDPAAAEARVGGARVALRRQGDRLVGESDRARGGEALTLRVADRLGNAAGAVQALVPAPTFGFSEAAAYPNPARTQTTLRYRLNQAAQVRADIYDTAGRRVRRLAGPGGAGLQTLRWDLRTGRGRAVRSGVYLVELRADGAGGRARERIKVAVIR